MNGTSMHIPTKQKAQGQVMRDYEMCKQSKHYNNQILPPTTIHKQYYDQNMNMGRKYFVNTWTMVKYK